MRNISKTMLFRRTVAMLLAVLLLTGTIVHASYETYENEYTYEYAYEEYVADDEYLEEAVYEEECAVTQVLYEEVTPASARGPIRISGHIDQDPTLAPWTLYMDGTLVVGPGYIHRSWSGGANVNHSVWAGSPNGNNPDLSDYIIRIEFPYENQIGRDVGSITSTSFTYRSISGLFDRLRNVVIIDGIANWDTSRINNIQSLFSYTHSLTYLNVSDWNTSNVILMNTLFRSMNAPNLDVSGWDVSNATGMNAVFMNTVNLTYLDVSSWDVSSATTMDNIFFGIRGVTRLDLSGWDNRNAVLTGATSTTFNNTNALRELVVGPNFRFHGNMDPQLTGPPNNASFTGMWQNVGSGTVSNPAGIHVLTSSQLQAHHNANPALETWVWQPRSFVPVTDISGVPATATVGIAVTLPALANPATATNRAITWTLVSGPATLIGNTLNPTGPGNVVIMATVINGLTPTSNFTQNFTIEVSAQQPTGFFVTFAPGAYGVGTPPPVQGPYAYWDIAFAPVTSTLTRPGFVQIAWRLDHPTHGALVVFGGSFLIRGDHTLYPEWVFVGQ